MYDGPVDEVSGQRVGEEVGYIDSSHLRIQHYIVDKMRC